MNSPVVAGIGLYQQYISPLKGFRCAYRALNLGWSCSEFGKRAFARHRTDLAWALLQRRLERCRAAFRALKASRLATSERQDQNDSAPYFRERFNAWLRRRKEAAKRNCSKCDPSPDPSACVDGVGACDCSPC